MKKIVFIGCLKSSYTILECLLQNNYMIDGIVTMDSSPINADFHSLIPLAKKYRIDCFSTKNVNDTETLDFIKEKSPDIIYCFGWSRLIGREILSVPSCGVVGFHPAALPANRGRHPLIWALALGLKKTASTFFLMDEGADTGSIISQREIDIDYEDDAQSLYNKVLLTAKKQVLAFTEEFHNNHIMPIPQNIDDGNTWRKRGRMDGQIDWRMSCDGIYNLVRALTHPYVGAHFMWNDREIKVWKCNVISTRAYGNIEPGKVLSVHSSTDYIVKAYDGIVHITDSEEVKLSKGDYLL